MRTTLNIDQDVLAAAKEIAQRERKTASWGCRCSPHALGVGRGCIPPPQG